MDRIERKELKHDKFIEQVGHTLEYAVEHKQQLLRWGLALLVLLVLATGFYFYQRSQAAKRQEALAKALEIQNAAVGKADPGQLSYPNQAEKEKALQKAWDDMVRDFGDSREGLIARLHRAALYASQGKFAEAERDLQHVIDKGDRLLSSQAKFALAQAYAAQKKYAQAETLLRDLMKNPTILVSKEQAQIALAQVLAKANPQEARKLLEPLRSERAAISRNALTLLAELPPAK